MMRLETKIAAKYVLFLFLLIVFLDHATGQDKIQKISLRAPADIKIDGNLSEWKNGLQAHNPIDGLWYSISNDDDDLYLTIRAPYKNACYKVVQGGITLTVSHSIDKGKRKKDLTNRSIVFPITKRLNYSFMSRASDYLSLKKDSINNKKRLDSLLNAINQNAAINFNKIQISGIKEIKTSTISINNTDDIKASGRFNKSMDFIYELAIPLKYFELSTDRTKTFSYNIKLNGDINQMPVNLNAPKVTVILGAGIPAPLNTLDIDTPTGFWGEYTLAKK